MDFIRRWSLALPMVAALVACTTTREVHVPVPAGNVDATVPDGAPARDTEPSEDDTAPPATSTLHEDLVKSAVEPYLDLARNIVIGVIDNGTPEIYSFGKDNRDGDTVFEVGSVSKVFTSVLLADAVGRGDMKLDDAVDGYVPAGTKVPTFEGTNMTLRDLSTHASGLPRLPASVDVYDANPYAKYDAKTLFADLASTELMTKPGTTYAYSNFGAGLLGELIAEHAQKSYDVLVQERITKPLAMTRTSTSYPTDKNVAQGHEGGRKVNAWDFEALAGAGAVRSTVHDLLLLAAATVDPPEGALGDALRLTTMIQATLTNAETKGKQKMGLAWHVDGPNTRLWHNGATAGCSSFVVIDTAKKQGIVMLMDSGDPHDAFEGALFDLITKL